VGLTGSRPPDLARLAAIPRWRRRRATLLGSFLLVALVLGAAMVVEVLADYRDAEQAATAQHAETAAALGRATDLFVARYLAIAETAASALTDAGERRRETARTLVARIHAEHPELEIVAFADAAGTVAAAHPPAAVGANVRDRFPAIFEGTTATVSRFGPGHLSAVAAVGVAASVREADGTLLGLVVVRLPIAHLGAQLGVALGGGAYVLLVEREGRVIVHGARPHVGWEERHVPAVAPVARALAGERVTVRGLPDPWTGQPLLGAIAPVPRLGWAVAVLQPAAAALAPARQALGRALATVGLVFAVGAALAWLLSASLAKPLTALADGVAALASGRLDYRIRGTWRNELGVLADAFDAMAARLSVLTRAGAHVATSLDLDATMAGLARLAVPEMADYCIVDIVGEDGVATFALAHRDPAREALLAEWRRRHPVDPAGDQPVARAMRSGQPVFIPEVTPEWIRARGRDAEDLRYLEALGPRSLMAVPLIARGRTLGSMAFAAAESGRRFTEADLALAAELARRAALAVDNARLYREAQDAVRARDEFLARASHELRTPLTVVNGHLALLDRKGGADAQARELIAVARRHVDRIVTLIADLLDASRLEAGALQIVPEPLDLRSVVSEAVAQIRPLAGARGVDLRDAVPGGIALVADRLKLEQVVVNLLSNAVKHTGRGGAVDVEAAASAGLVELRVRDSGAGIPPEYLERIFEPFFQVGGQGGHRRAGREGTGLGLAIVRRLVDLHGGAVHAESEGQGRGSTFVVRLPAAPGKASAA
jgi:signal transduction histidine kinase/HAMP domain-containing protein